MNTCSRKALLAIVLAVGATGGAEVVFAQARARTDGQAAGAGGPIVKVREIAGVGPRAIVKTPDIYRGKNPSKDWVELSVSFDTDPEWVDELTFQYYALLHDKKKDEYNLFRGTVTHVDIARGRAHMSTMYLRPTAIARYGDVVAVAVEVLHGGEVVDSKGDERMSKGAKLAKDWWRSPQLKVKEGYVLPRAQTPFAFLSYDDYEATR